MSAPSADAFPELGIRERQVLGLLSDGLSNRAIGERLDISANTVANCVSSVLLCLGVSDRAAAAKVAGRRLGS